MFTPIRPFESEKALPDMLVWLPDILVIRPSPAQTFDSMAVDIMAGTMRDTNRCDFLDAKTKMAFLYLRGLFVEFFWLLCGCHSRSSGILPKRKILD
jgi:hypothetical protein